MNLLCGLRSALGDGHDFCTTTDKMVSGRTISGASVARELHSLIWVAAWGWVVLEAASIIEYKVNDEATQKTRKITTVVGEK